jgi:hypothetical protein
VKRCVVRPDPVVGNVIPKNEEPLAQHEQTKDTRAKGDADDVVGPEKQAFEAVHHLNNSLEDFDLRVLPVLTGCTVCTKHTQAQP